MALTELTSKDLLKTWRERINEILSEIKKYAVINHASSDTKYGLGDENKFGHLKLSDSLNSPADKTSGIAATPYAISEVYKIANSALHLGEKIEGTLEVTTIKGDLIGNADTATLALKAISDELGNNINQTYATKTELNQLFSGELTFSGSLKRAGTSIQWRDILTDKDSSFLYQSSYAGYMPALNLQTQDGRIGFGTYTNLCRWDYFLSTNETNTPNSYVDLLSTGLKVHGNLDVRGELTLTESANFSSDLTVRGLTTINNDINVTGNTTIGKTLSVTGDSTFSGVVTLSNNVVMKNPVTISNTLSVTGKISGGSKSSFATDIYINSPSNSLILRNDGSSTYLLVSDTVNGSWNALRPFSFNMSTGAVTMSHAVTLGSTLSVAGNVTSNGTISASKVYNAVFNDYAEFFEKGEETEVGDFIALDSESEKEVYVKASKQNHFIVGVHSDTYGHILGGEGSIEESMKTHIPVGLVGRVYAKIVGKINKGDYVVLSDISGVGRKYNEETDSPLDIIGGAVESSNEDDVKLVKIKLK